MSNETEDFRDFCIAQLDRLGVFRDYQFMNTEAQRELRKWLESKCGTEERVERVISAAVELEAMPTIAALIRILTELFPPTPSGPVASPDCHDCSGSGWMVLRVGAYEGVAPCRCGGKPPACTAEKRWDGGIAETSREYLP